jgi:hypothetical protein
MDQSLNQFFGVYNAEKQWKNIYTSGCIFVIVALAILFADIIIGNITGGNLSMLPKTATERFQQFHTNRFLGLYNLDFLNMTVQIIMIPVYFALYGANRDQNRPLSLLALIIFLFGSELMVANNAALPMLEISENYYSVEGESQKVIYAAAGESLLARGTHGSLGMLPGFFLPNVANLIISIIMLKGKTFGTINSLTGIAGSILMILYVILVSFVKEAGTSATALAMPGGLLLMTWMILFSIRLYRLGRKASAPGQ